MDDILGLLCLGGTIYYGIQSAIAYKKLECIQKTENAFRDKIKNNGTIQNVDQFFANHTKIGKPHIWFISGKGIPFGVETKNNIKENSSNFKPTELYLKTTEYSYGFEMETRIEMVKFYLSNSASNRLLIDPEDSSELIVIDSKWKNSNKMPLYEYWPLYLLGLSSTTSYEIEYLMSSETLNVCGLVEYDIKTGVWQLTEPLWIFNGGIQDAFDSLCKKVSSIEDDLRTAFLATIGIGLLSIFIISHLYEKKRERN